MVTRRQFGYWLRDKIAELDPELRIELGFSEGLLESWAAREAFLLFCLLIDPDPPTWRAWLGYQNAVTGKDFSAPSVTLLPTCDFWLDPETRLPSRQSSHWPRRRVANLVGPAEARSGIVRSAS